MTYASEVRSGLEELAQTISASLSKLNSMEDEQILPRFEASIRDFDSAVNSARQLKNGGSKSETASGSRAIANAEFGKGRVAWEAAPEHFLPVDPKMGTLQVSRYRKRFCIRP